MAEIISPFPPKSVTDGIMWPTALYWISPWFGGPWRASEGFRRPLRASKGLRGPQGVLGALEGFRELRRASMSLFLFLFSFFLSSFFSFSPFFLLFSFLLLPSHFVTDAILWPTPTPSPEGVEGAPFTPMAAKLKKKRMRYQQMRCGEILLYVLM